MQKFSYLRSSNAGYIDEMFSQWLENPNSVDPSWQFFFEGLELGTEVAPPVPSGAPAAAPAVAPELASEAKVAELIQAYRDQGILAANLDPLGAPPASAPELELSRFGLSQADLGKTFSAGKLLGMGPVKLSDMIAKLKDTYCRTVGVEISHIQNTEAREWLRKRIESTANRDPELNTETRKFIYKRLAQSEGLERFLHTRYVAQKRFSIEGGEGTIPALDCMIEIGAELGASEFVMGMAHRGRLNVLANIFGKPVEQIFVEFEGTYQLHPEDGEGDVKYHKGWSRDFTTRKGKQVHLSLASNPSHLEFVDPVMEGITRAKQQLRGDESRKQVIPVQIHGDAAFAGQGVVYETLNFELLKGYTTGGTIHLVVNNQIGFTADTAETRSTRYATDLGKMMDAPILHVNGDDPEAIWWASRLCMEYRQKFGKDAFIDLICYRKHGHNEGDEPAYTQPVMYKKIKAHPTPREAYARVLAGAGVLSEQELQGIVDGIVADLTAAQTIAREKPPQPYVSSFESEVWKKFRQPKNEAELFAPVKTQLPEKVLRELGSKLHQIPSGFHLNSKLVRFMDARQKSLDEGKGIDWGTGEALAFASLLVEGHPVRLSGQDAQRGTFSHRQSVLHDSETGEIYVPLNHLAPKQAPYQAYNSHLSETGVLGFEYGYSTADPDTLVIWEAQFGDFANGAQVIIDQFIATSESKWKRVSGLVLLLPHGYEGQAAEHSSARLERFLALCGRENMNVCNLTTPAQIFHALRRQLKREFRKPLVVMSPKSLLRHPLAVSDLSEFSSAGFQEVLDDPTQAKPDQAKRVGTLILCSGKVYYDLVQEREARGRTDDVAIVRIEQFYPWPAEMLAEIVNRYSAAKDIVWVQEEPRNMGGWTYIFNSWMGGYSLFSKQVGGRAIRYVGRDIAAAPAVGSPKAHELEQKALLAEAFGGGSTVTELKRKAK